MDKKLEAFKRTLEVLDKLREECPWDKKQTNESLRPLTIEECYELTDAIINENDEELKIELGDVLLHILFYAKIAEEKKKFNIENVCNSLCDKLIYRHPHVFGSAEAKNSEAVERSWAILKLREGKNKTTLSGVPKSLPSLIKAWRIQDKARSAGFDWEKKEDVWEKVKEEIAEVENEIHHNSPTLNLEKEFGDLLFSIINAARLYGVNPENALERTNQKFINRFNYMESKASEQGKLLKEMSLEEMEDLWNKGKKLE